MNPAKEPVGVDPAVQEALAVLERCMVAAARRDGHEMQTFVLLWATEKDGDAYGGSLMKGDVSDDVMEFLVELLEDGSGDTSVPDPLARLA